VLRHHAFSKTTEDHTQEYWLHHFNDYLKPLIEENPELEARRSQPLRGEILGQIITDLVTSHLVVADLTHRNPNVYWELGIRHSFTHRTVMIAEYGTQFPFDVAHYNIEALRRLHALRSEFSRNRLALDAVEKAFEKNQEAKWVTPVAPTERFRIAAIESLVVNRYVEETEKFFFLR